MSRLRIVIQRIEDETQPERVIELDRIEVPHLDARSLEKETALDHLETQTLAQGQEVMRHLLVRQWEGVEQQLVPATVPRRKAAWPAALTPVVAAALAEGAPAPPAGVTAADWERLLAVRREQQTERDAAALRRLGPEVRPAQILASADEVLVR